MGTASTAGNVETALKLVADIGQRQRMQTGTYVFLQGEKADSIYLVLSGSFTVLIEEEAGELVLAYLTVGDIFGEVGLHKPQASRSASVRARTSSEVLRVSYERYLALAANHPELWQLTLAQLSRQLVRSTHKVQSLVRLNAAERILYILNELCDLPGAATVAGGALVSVTREELGNVAGCSREKASKALAQLKEQGLVDLRGRKIFLKRETAGKRDSGICLND